MRSVRLAFPLLAIAFCAACFPAAAQLSPTQSDPLARIRESAKGNTQACSATAETLCEQVAPKIIANAQGESPLAENIGRLADMLNSRDSRQTQPDRAAAWGISAFRSAGLDVHGEKYTGAHDGAGKLAKVVAEIRGREKPDELVIVAARLETQAPDKFAADKGCAAATLIETARDISRTGVRPRRSIRFLLLTDEGQSVVGAREYLRAHRGELDQMRAAIAVSEGCGKVTGFLLNGRHDIEGGVRESMKPVESLGANHYDFGASPLSNGDFDFVLEGIPVIAANRMEIKSLPDSKSELTESEISSLKQNCAILAVTAFGIAERAAPIGPRQSRAQIETILKTTGMDQQMKNAGLWAQWESHERGRVP